MVFAGEALNMLPQCYGHTAGMLQYYMARRCARYLFRLQKAEICLFGAGRAVDSVASVLVGLERFQLRRSGCLENQRYVLRIMSKAGELVGWVRAVPLETPARCLIAGGWISRSRMTMSASKELLAVMLKTANSQHTLNIRP